MEEEIRFLIEVNDEMKECKRHRWRVGAGMGVMIIKRELISPLYKNIWCERCGKRIKAHLYSDYQLKEMKLVKRKPVKRWRI